MLNDKNNRKRKKKKLEMNWKFFKNSPFEIIGDMF